MGTRSIGIGIGVLFVFAAVAAGPAHAIKSDEILSQHIREADGSSGQNTNAGAGVKTGHIQDNAVSGPKIADRAVTGPKIADGAVTQEKLGADVAAAVSSLEDQVAELTAQVAALQTLLQNFSRSGDTVTISGANLQIVSGSGATDGAVNGLGNLILGYGEERYVTTTRTGSHNLVLGFDNSYTSYGGIVGGDQNQIAGPFASVLGGRGNSAAGNFSAILGGTGNSTPSSAAGWGQSATISGGYGNSSWGFCANIAGGHRNYAYGHYSTVSGGKDRVTSSAGMYDWVAGELFQDF